MYSVSLVFCTYFCLLEWSLLRSLFCPDLLHYSPHSLNEPFPIFYSTLYEVVEIAARNTEHFTKYIILLEGIYLLQVILALCNIKATECHHC
jgi:hypothetical protein